MENVSMGLPADVCVKGCTAVTDGFDPERGVVTGSPRYVLTAFIFSTAGMHSHVGDILRQHQTPTSMPKHVQLCESDICQGVAFPMARRTLCSAVSSTSLLIKACQYFKSEIQHTTAASHFISEHVVRRAKEEDSPID